MGELPKGMKVEMSDGPSLAYDLLYSMNHHDYPWDGPPVVVPFFDLDGSPHPLGAIPLIKARYEEGGEVELEPITIDELAEFLVSRDIERPPDPITAVAWVNELYIGSRDEISDTIGDNPGDAEARCAMVRFVGGGVQAGLHIRGMEPAMWSSWEQSEAVPGQMTNREILDSLDLVLRALNTGTLDE